MASKLQFDKLEKTNCVYGRIPAPGRSGDGYKYLGDFDTYEQCAASANIDPNAKAITHHGTKSGGFSRQCFSINDNNTRVENQNDTTCGIAKPKPDSLQEKRENLADAQEKLAKLNQLIANYNQLYQTYLQEVEADVSKQNPTYRKYPYTVKNSNAFENVIKPADPFPANGTEDACFKSCADNKDCVYALYSNSGCGIECNPNKCLLYGADADGIVPTTEAKTTLPTCPTSASTTDAWCKKFHDAISNKTIPVLVLRTGGSNWRSFAQQMPGKVATSYEERPNPPCKAGWWQNGNECLQICALNSQTRHPDGTCICNRGGSNQNCNFMDSSFKCVNNSCKRMRGVTGEDAPFAVDLTTNIQWWGWADAQFSDVNYAPRNEISLQFRYFAEYWLNAYGLQSGSTQVLIGDSRSSRNLGTYTFSRITGPDTTKIMYGPWISADIPVQTTKMLSNNVIVYMIQHGSYTKMVTSDGQEKYYTGNINDFKPSNWNSYSSTGGGNYLLKTKGDNYVGAFNGRSMTWNSNSPYSGGKDAGLKTAAILAQNAASAQFKYNYSAYEKKVWSSAPNTNAMMGQLPPQVAQMSVPSWKFLGTQNSPDECKTASMNDPAHVYDTITYFNASYDNPRNGNKAFAGSCYGHVAGAPASTLASASAQSDKNATTMTPPYRYTKLGGKNGINILKQLYQLNEQIVAISDDLKLPPPNLGQGAGASGAGASGAGASGAGASGARREGFTQVREGYSNTELLRMNDAYGQAEADELETSRILLQSRIKLGVGIVIGVLMGYLVYRFMTATSELPKAVRQNIDAVMPAALTANATNANATNANAPNANANATNAPADAIDLDAEMETGK
jgi:hypothetical protein